MKALRLATAFCAAFALATIIAVQCFAGNAISLPGTTGPSLGDTNANLSTYGQALQNETFANFTSFTTVTVAASNTTATLALPGVNFLTAAIGTTGTMALPTAKPGANVQIINNTGQGMNLVPNPTPYTAGGTDDINNSSSATAAYVNMSNGKVADCFAPAGGHWWCQSGN